MSKRIWKQQSHFYYFPKQKLPQPQPSKFHSGTFSSFEMFRRKKKSPRATFCLCRLGRQRSLVYSASWKAVVDACTVFKGLLTTTRCRHLWACVLRSAAIIPRPFHPSNAAERSQNSHSVNLPCDRKLMSCEKQYLSALPPPTAADLQDFRQIIHCTVNTVNATDWCWLRIAEADSRFMSGEQSNTVKAVEAADCGVPLVPKRDQN